LKIAVAFAIISAIASMKLPRVVCLRMVSAAILLLIAMTDSLPAAERTWDGTGRSSDWTDQANWVNGIVPVPGDSLRFPFGAGHLSNTNDYAAGTDFNVLTFAAAGYTLRGNSIDLSGGLAVTHSTGNSICYLPITLLASQTFSVSQPGTTLFLNGNIDMSTRTLTFDVAGQVIVVGDIDNSRLFRAQLRKLGSGVLWMLQPANYDADTLVNGGTLRVDGRITNSFVIVNSSGILRGAGRIGPLRANAGGTVQPGYNNTDILDMFGDVELNAGSTFSVRLNGNIAGSTYDQLRVRGTVTLGGTLNVTTGYTPAVGEVFTIIDNDGSDDVVGTFAGLPQGAQFTINGRPFRISYGGRFGPGIIGRDNDVTIEAIPAVAIWDGQGGLNRRWSLPTNWVGDIIPYPGDDIYFPNAVTTTNDFPAGRLFGSITFGGGANRIDGNPAIFDGRLVIESACDIEIYVPMTLRDGFRLVHPGDVWFGAPITLSRNQTLAVEHTNLLLTIHQGINAGPYDLTLENQTWDRSGYPTHASIYLYEQISGTGRLIKEGPGQCRFIQCEILGSETIVNEGELTECPRIAGAVTVNAGGSLRFAGRVAGPISINSGGLLDGGQYLTNVTANGGTFAPTFSSFVYDGLRMVSNSTYVARILRDISGELDSMYALVVGPVQLANTTLEVRVDEPLPHGSVFEVLKAFEGTAATFQNMSEGARFVVNQNVLTFGYGGGVDFNVTAGAPFAWDGGGPDGYWTTPANWVGDVAPLPSHQLIFPASAIKRIATNDFPAQSMFSAIIFDGNSYTLRGNALRLTNGVFHNVSGQNLVELGLRFFPSPSTNPLPAFVAGSGLLRLEGSISNSLIRKTGPGTLRLAGPENNPQFDIRALDGTLDLGKSSGAVAVTGTLEVGDGTNAAVVNYLENDQLADTADVIVRRLARLQLDGHIDTIDRLSGDGVVSLGIGLSQARLKVLGFGTFGGNITGNGGITKAGMFTLTLTGTNTFSRQTIVESGALQIDGLHTNSPTILNGGSLGGRGRLGNIQGNLGGILSPGQGFATFQNYLHSRDVQLNGNVTFQPAIFSSSPDFENSRLQVTGTVDLGGSLLQARRFFTPPANTAFVVIDNDGADPIVGTFSGLPEGAITGADGLPFRVSYVGGTGNDVVLTRVAAPPTTFNGIQVLDTNQVRLQGLGISGVSYTIEYTFSLTPPVNWLPAAFATATNGLWTVIQNVVVTQQFFRAISP
jgi:autotransporter-associated beta strand protein